MMKTLKFGCEIETVGATRMTLAHAIQSVVGGRAYNEGRSARVDDARGRTWKVVPDGSLSSGEYSGEVVSPVLEYQDIEQLQQVVRALRGAGARTDSSCGIHIHVDGSRFDAKTAGNLVKMVHKQERLLEHALRVSETRLSRYCRPIDADFMARLTRTKPRTKEALSYAWYGRHNVRPERYCPTRYRTLNLNSYFYRGTIEVRAFNGTLHAGEVKAYIHLVLGLAAKALTAKSASEKRREFNPATAKYDMRVLLLGLGFLGDEFKSTRHHLTKHLAGSAAWKGERRDRRATEAQAA
jgi:hypothetical protein